VKLGAFWCFTLNGISYLAVIATLFAIRPHFVPPATQMPVIQSMREGIDFLRKREGMASLVVLAFGITLLSYPLITFLPVMARDVFHGGANTFTLFLCLSGAGAVTGALLVAGSASQSGQARKSLMVMAILGIVITAFGLSRVLAASAVLVFVSGSLLMIVFALNTSMVQLYVSDTMRGRVMSVYNVAFRGGMPLGSLVSGLLIKQTSAPAIMAGNGLLVVALALYFLLAGKKLSKL
jgi:predicted MFS family arabinose efflux permease